MNFKFLSNYKLILFFLVVFLFSLSILSIEYLNLEKAGASGEKDTIAIRVIPNPEHRSAATWYKSRGFTGSPQNITVDGYNAIRDGRTVYVNVANVANNLFYTNIYLISYNQDAENLTVDIFARILKNWKFNTNLSLYDFCENKPETACLIDADCGRNDFCNSEKALVTRDTKRLEGLQTIKESLSVYHKKNNSFPKLSAGTYLPHISISVWPSWQKVLAQELAINLPEDPLNRLGACGNERFHHITCWDEKQKEFADPLPGNGKFDLPYESHVYVYEGSADGQNYSLCAAMESLYSSASDGACVVACVDECSGDEKRCVGSSVQTCGNYDADSCRDWSKKIDCPDFGKVCRNGECIFNVANCATSLGCLTSPPDNSDPVIGYCSQGTCYTCKLNYTWIGNYCVANTQIASCGGSLPSNAVWNTSDDYTQTWNGSTWTPVKTAVYNETPSNDNCHFKCAGSSTWDDNTCLVDVVNCTTIPGCLTYTPFNSITVDEYCPSGACYICNSDSTWDDGACVLNTADCATPPGCLTSPPDNSAPVSGYCSLGTCYACDLNYTWIDNNCVADTQIASCGGSLPDNAVWNTSDDYIQTWNVSAWSPVKTAVYSEISSDNDCRFKCVDNSTWDDNFCVADTQIASCGGSLPDNAVWNTSDDYIQTWNVSAWAPVKTAVYSEISSEDDCYFKCDDDSVWNSVTQNCDPICIPSSCFDLKKDCGSVWNGCEFVDCGSCSYASTCSDGKCVCDNQCVLGETKCDLNNIALTCVPWGSNSCPGWNGGQNCSATGKICFDGACVTPASCINISGYPSLSVSGGRIFSEGTEFDLSGAYTYKVLSSPMGGSARYSSQVKFSGIYNYQTYFRFSSVENKWFWGIHIWNPTMNIVKDKVLKNEYCDSTSVPNSSWIHVSPTAYDYVINNDYPEITLAP